METASVKRAYWIVTIIFYDDNEFTCCAFCDGRGRFSIYLAISSVIHQQSPFILHSLMAAICNFFWKTENVKRPESLIHHSLLASRIMCK